MNTLKGWTLSKALCNAMEGMGTIQANLFKKAGTGSNINCNSRNMAGMDLSEWRDESAQSGGTVITDSRFLTVFFHSRRCRNRRGRRLRRSLRKHPGATRGMLLQIGNEEQMPRNLPGSQKQRSGSEHPRRMYVQGCHQEQMSSSSRLLFPQGSYKG